MVYGPDMEVLFVREPMTVSWLSMPGWQLPDHLRQPTPGVERGRLVRHELESDLLGGPVVLQVYLPAGYDDGGMDEYPVVYYHAGAGALARGALPTSLDNLLGAEVQPLIAVFVEAERPVFTYRDRYVESLEDELVPFIDASYRTIAEPAGRASIGGGFMGVSALSAALQKPDLFGKAAAQSMCTGTGPGILIQLVRTPAEQPLDLYIESGTYDGRAAEENWDMRALARAIVESLVDHGHPYAQGTSELGRSSNRRMT